MFVCVDYFCFGLDVMCVCVCVVQLKQVVNLWSAKLREDMAKFKDSQQRQQGRAKQVRN